jgi:hypothetical protein
MKLKLLGLFLFLAIEAKAQQKEPIEADRPDQTETPAIVPRGMFQIETGFTYEKSNSSTNSYALPSVLWKYGVNDNFELRLITEYVLERASFSETSGFSPVLIGCKIKISEEKGILPKTSFIGHVALPNLASTKYKTDFYAPQFRFTMQHSLSEKLSLSYNLGSEWNGFTAEPTFIYTLSTGYSFSETLGGYLEFFGFAPQNNKAEHNFDGGLTYLISNNFMVDLSAGAGITNNAPDYYVSAGCSLRL